MSNVQNCRDWLNKLPDIKKVSEKIKYVEDLILNMDESSAKYVDFNETLNVLKDYRDASTVQVQERTVGISKRNDCIDSSSLSTESDPSVMKITNLKRRAVVLAELKDNLKKYQSPNFVHA